MLLAYCCQQTDVYLAVKSMLITDQFDFDVITWTGMCIMCICMMLAMLIFISGCCVCFIFEANLWWHSVSNAIDILTTVPMLWRYINGAIVWNCNITRFWAVTGRSASVSSMLFVNLLIERWFTHRNQLIALHERILLRLNFIYVVNFPVKEKKRKIEIFYKKVIFSITETDSTPFFIFFTISLTLRIFFSFFCKLNY